MRSSCPNCGAPTEVLPSDFGRPIKCYDCQAMLAVNDEGKLQVTSAPSPKPAGSPPMDYLGSSTSGGNFGSGGSASGWLSYLGGFLFATGAILVILFLFLPLIDVQFISARRAAIQYNEMRENRKEVAEKPEPGQPFKKNERREKDRQAQQEKLDDAESSVQQRRPWYSVGMMAGFFFVAGGAICFLSLTGVRRIVGAIVLSGEILFIFYTHAITSTIYTIQAVTSRYPQ